MKKIFILLLACAATACSSLMKEEEPMVTLNTEISLPEGEKLDIDLTKIEVRLQNKTAPFTYTANPDADGKVSFNVHPGKYDMTFAGAYKTRRIYVNASVSEFLLIKEGVVDDEGKTRDPLIKVELNVVKPPEDPTIIQEIYYHGSSTLAGVNYTKDRYISLFNNAGEGGKDIYLDSLCIATVYPFNSTGGSNAWKGADTLAIAQMFWMIPGNGKDYRLKPGEGVTIAAIAAVNHKERAVSGLELNRVRFGCYSENLINHEIAADVIPLVCYMGGKGNAWALSIHSPAIVIFRPPMGVDAYYNDKAMWERYEPGMSSGTKYYHIPKSWIIDGVECIDVPAGALKRLPSTVDASYVYIRAAHYSGTCVTRKLDEESCTESVKVYMDTNNSDADFDHDAPLKPFYCR